MLATILTRWVVAVQRRASLSLFIIALLTVLAASYAFFNFGINSDLGDLIDPGAERQWNKDNEAFKKAFPQYLETAVLVLSGNSPEALGNSADRIARSLDATGLFDAIYAPGRDAFTREHSFYYLDTAQLEDAIDRVAEAQPVLSRLSQSPNLNGLFGLLTDGLVETKGDAELPQAMRELIARVNHSMTAVAAGADASIRWQDVFFGVDASTGERFYQLLMVQGKKRFDAQLPYQQQVEAIRAVLSSTPLDAGVQARLTGEVVLADEEIASALQGVGIAGGLSLLALGILLGFGVRSARIVQVVFALLLVGAIWTACYASLAVGKYNTLSLVFLVMFFGLGVDFALHYCLRIQEAMARHHKPLEALKEATQAVGPAISVCVLTSALAFMAFLPTPYRGLAELGLISAGGMFVAWLLTFTLIPAWFSRFGFPVELPNLAPKRFDPANLPSSAVLVFALALLAVSLVPATNLRFDYNVLEMRDANSEAMKTLLELQREGVLTDYSLGVIAKDAEQAAALKDRLLQLSSVQSVLNPEDLIPTGQEDKQYLLEDALSLLAGTVTLNARATASQAQMDISASKQALLAILDTLQTQNNFNPDDAAALARLARGIRQLHAGSARTQTFEQAAIGSLSTTLAWLGQALQAAPFTLAEVPAELRSRFIGAQGQRLLWVLPADPVHDTDKMEIFLQQVNSVAPNSAGRPMVEWGVGQAVLESFRTAVLIAALAIFMVLMLLFQRPLPAMLVLVPIVFTLILTFAFAYLSGLSMNMANILVVPLIFGLGVDTGVHIVHRYQQGDAVTVQRSSTMRAVMLSALTTIATFASLSISPHKGAASIGYLLAVAIGILMLVSYVILPALLTVALPRTPQSLEVDR